MLANRYTRQGRDGERGSILATAVIAFIPILALVGASISISRAEIQKFQVERDSMLATHRALSAIEVGKRIVADSTYESKQYPGQNKAIWTALSQDDYGSLWTRPNSEDALYLNLDTGERVWETMQLASAPPSNLSPYRRLEDVSVDDSDRIPVFVAKISDSWHMLEAAAGHSDTTRTARVMIREKDPFSRYNLLTDSRPQPVSVRMSGDVHSNKYLYFMYGNWALSDFVSSVGKFQWKYGANWNNVDFDGGFNQEADRIELPDFDELVDRLRPEQVKTNWQKKRIKKGFDYVYVGSDFSNVTIDLKGEYVKVRAYDARKRRTRTVYNGPADVSRIYVVNDIAGLGGDLNGRLTIATEGSVVIDDSIRYIDNDGDPAMLDPTSPKNYKNNPDYDGDSVLGLVTLKGNVVYGETVPTNFELHAAIFAKGGQTIPFINITEDGNNQYLWGEEYLKKNIFTLGVSVLSYSKYRGVVSGSRKIAGFDEGLYLFDRGALDNPPPFFIEIDRPQFKGTMILEAFTDA